MAARSIGFAIAIACILHAAFAAEAPYTLNLHTPFEFSSTGIRALIGQSFVVRINATFRDIRSKLQDGEIVKVIDAKVDDDDGVALILVADPAGQQIFEKWYAPADMGLMTLEGWQKFQAQMRADCGSDTQLTLAQRHQIQIGMTPGCVEAAWGPPYRKNRTLTAASTVEQWVFIEGSYVYFTNGVVSAIQETLR